MALNKSAVTITMTPLESSYAAKYPSSFAPYINIKIVECLAARVIRLLNAVSFLLLFDVHCSF